MKNDDLERLEKSQDVQQLIHFAKEQYEQEKSEHTPADFSSLMQAVRKNQKKRDRKSTRLNSSHNRESRMPSSA